MEMLSLAQQMISFLLRTRIDVMLLSPNDKSIGIASHLKNKNDCNLFLLLSNTLSTGYVAEKLLDTIVYPELVSYCF
jgi:hypothetical protein